MKRRDFLKLIAIGSFAPQVIQAKMTLREVTENDELKISPRIYEELPIMSSKDVEVIYESEPYELKEEIIGNLIEQPIYNGYHQKKINRSKTRMLNLYNSHTKEKLKTVYYKDGEYQAASLQRINNFFRDFRENEETDIDIKLIDLIYTLQKKQSKTQPLYLLSGYRTNKTNRKVGGARHSEHKNGRAADIRPKYATKKRIKKLRQDAKKINIGGVGYYSKSGFIHVDSGRVRSWNG